MGVKYGFPSTLRAQPGRGDEAVELTDETSGWRPGRLPAVIGHDERTHLNPEPTAFLAELPAVPPWGRRTDRFRRILGGTGR